ncbi:MAG: hypothetical protein Q8869_00105 [Candidatus Phytoplasma australasiaticum]|nr:hypothetical protein [Candidatus Phytoplasma australasiaticum]
MLKLTKIKFICLLLLALLLIYLFELQVVGAIHKLSQMHRQHVTE